MAVLFVVDGGIAIVCRLLGGQAIVKIDRLGGRVSVPRRLGNLKIWYLGVGAIGLNSGQGSQATN